MTGTPEQLIRTPEVPGVSLRRDPLAVVPQVLELVRLSGAIFFRSDFRAPWAYASPTSTELATVLPPADGSLVMFHIIAEGSCWVALNDGIRHEVRRGDVVVMPYGDPNTWGSHEAAEPIPIATLLPPPPWAEMPHLRYGGDGDETKVVCGYLFGDAVLFDPVLQALPPLFVVHPPPGPATTWLNASIEYALSAGGASVVDASHLGQRLPELLFTEILRLYLEQRGEPRVTGWLAALRDPIVGHALALLHAEPQRDWTVAELARAVAVSRTVLVDRFIHRLGQPPIRYLTEWRLNLASGLLRATDESVGDIAAKVGYTAEAAFSRAFKRAFGQAPARWRGSRPDGAARSVAVPR